VDEAISQTLADESKVNGMDDIFERKPIVDGSIVIPPIGTPIDQALGQLEGGMDIEQKHESWWSILRFWIRELRWRRAFWKKVDRPVIEELEP
jgi:hypothetical protein